MMLKLSFFICLLFLAICFVECMKRKKVKVDKFEFCYLAKNAPFKIHQFEFKELRGLQHSVTGRIEVLEVLQSKDIEGEIQATKCHSREELDTCEPVPTLKPATSVCSIITIKEVGLREVFNKINPPFGCPVQKVNYTVTDLTYDINKFELFAFSTNYWKLKFLATGESYASLSFAFRISPGYISRIVKNVLKLCSEKLPPIFMPPPSTQDLLERAKDFFKKWNFPNCIAAVDGKHVRIFCPGKSGSLFYNYKDFFSIVLLAFVDANCKFMMVDIGSYGKEGDSGIIQKSNIGKLINSDTFYPPAAKLSNTNVVLPYIIVGDEAFRLSKHMMKPFARNDARSDGRKAIFNYRLSRARRVSENAFGLLSQIFRIFYLPIAVKPEVTDTLIMTACCLHNLLRDAFLEKENISFFQVASLDQAPTENMISLRCSGGFSNAEGFVIRENFCKYFNSGSGAISWQTKQVNRNDI